MRIRLKTKPAVIPCRFQDRRHAVVDLGMMTQKVRSHSPVFGLRQLLPQPR